MRYIRQEYLDQAYKVVCRVNLTGKVCNNVRFHNTAFRIYFSEISRRPVLMEYLGRALRELPRHHPDVLRLAKDAYVVKQLQKYCDEDWASLRLKRLGGANGRILDIHAGLTPTPEKHGAASNAIGDQSVAQPLAIRSPSAGGNRDVREGGVA